MILNPRQYFFSAGFDGDPNDPLANLLLHEEDYFWITEKVSTIAAKTLLRSHDINFRRWICP